MISQSSDPTNGKKADSELNVSTQWKNLGISDEQKQSSQNENSTLLPIDDKALRMMHKMGFKLGSGLGKNEQGITEPIDVTGHLGKRGLGLNIPDLNATKEMWDFSKEEINVEEKVIWLENEGTDNFSCFFKNVTAWMKEGVPNHNVQNEINYCDRDILHDVLQAKNIFDELNILELNQARTKANPFETIRSVFFMNRAALKMANIDAATGFMFSNIDQNVYHKNNMGPYYFADVCAGPGGFSEYILWRKGWVFKGFGMTLRGEHDFKLYESTCASPVGFQAFYGKLEDGNVCCPENIEDFKQKIRHETDGKGVHFMMSDGGFCVDGNENLQEILSKNIYICQCLVALEIVREHGHFVIKLFDVFTPFSVGLLYLMYKCFRKVTILKPNSSRPANSERYFICSDLKKNSIVNEITEYMWSIVRKLWSIKDNSELDVLEIVPMEIIKRDEKFYSYIIQSNNSLGKRQIIGLQKLAAFCRNSVLIENRQEKLRKQCLSFWQIPDKSRVPQQQFKVDDLLNLVTDKPELVFTEILYAQPREIDSMDKFDLIFSNVADWHYCPMYCSRKSNSCNFYAGVGSSKVCRLQGSKWVKIKNLQLVKETLLYGEFVKEKKVLKTDVSANAEAETYKYSLHVIDALRLGEKSLANMKFKERIELIQVYCKSVNRESVPNSVRIRHKPINTLVSIVSQPLFMKDRQNNGYSSPLPALGYDTFSEEIDVNSLLMLKTDDHQYFQSTYLLRVQIFLNPLRDQSEENSFTVEQLINRIKPK